MRNKKKLIFTAILLAFIILYSFYPSLDTKLTGFLIDSETAYIDRVIDGDTVKNNETSIRLLGINCPEKGEQYSSEAGKFLENLVLNKTVALEFGKEKEDRYGRTLGYIFIGKENINLDLVKEGYANFYFPSGRDMHYSEFKEAWEKCMEENKNLCEKSENKCATCIELTEFNHEEEIITLYNNCGFDCELNGWDIKDEGRKHFNFQNFVLKENKKINIITGEGEDNQENLYWKGEEYVWTQSGDTIFLRDDKGKLVLWESY